MARHPTTGSCSPRVRKPWHRGYEPPTPFLFLFTGICIGSRLRAKPVHHAALLACV
jgi:hypothetical protein